MARTEHSHAGKIIGANVAVDGTDYDSLVIKTGTSAAVYSAPVAGKIGMQFTGAATEQVIVAETFASTLTFSQAFYFRINEITTSSAQLNNPRNTASAKTGSILVTNAASPLCTIRTGADVNIATAVALAKGVVYLARFAVTAATATTGKTKGTITRVSDGVVVYGSGVENVAANNGTTGMTSMRLGKLDAASVLDIEIWGEATDSTYALIDPVADAVPVGTLSIGTATVLVAAAVPIADGSSGTAVATVSQRPAVAAASSGTGTASADIAVSTPVLAPLRVTDDFARADAAILDVTPTGQTWQVLSGSWGTIGNQAYAPGANGRAVVDLESPDQIVSVRMTAIPATQFCGVVARCTNNTNLYFADVSAAGTGRLYKTVAGTNTQIGSFGGYTLGDVLTLSVIGTQLQVSIAGTVVLTITDSSLTTGNLAGMRAGSVVESTSRFDDFTATPTDSLPSTGTAAVTVSQRPAVPAGSSSSGTAVVAVNQRPQFPVTEGSVGTAVATVVPSEPVAAAKASSGTAAVTAAPTMPVAAASSSSGTAGVSMVNNVAVTLIDGSSGTGSAGVLVIVPVTAASSSSGTAGVTAVPSEPVTIPKASSGTAAATIVPAQQVTAGTDSSGNAVVVPVPGGNISASVSGAGNKTIAVVANVAVPVADGSTGTAAATVNPAVQPRQIETLAADSFNRGDDPAALGTTDTGQLWATFAGTQGIVGGQAYSINAGLSGAQVQTNSTDHEVSARLTVLTAVNHGVVARYLNSTNYYFADATLAGTVRLYKVVAGVITPINNTIAANFVAGEVIGLRVVGSTLTVLRNGAPIYSTTDTDLPTGTRAGLRSSNTGPRWDDFAVTTDVLTPSSGTAVATVVQSNSVFANSSSSGNDVVTYAPVIQLAVPRTSTGTASVTASNGQSVPVTVGSDGNAVGSVTAGMPVTAVSSSIGTPAATVAANMPTVAASDSDGNATATVNQRPAVTAAKASSGTSIVTGVPSEPVAAARSSSGTVVIVFAAGVTFPAATQGDGAMSATVALGGRATANFGSTGEVEVMVAGDSDEYYPGRHTAEGPVITRERGGSVFIRTDERYQVFWFLDPITEQDSGWQVKIGDREWQALESSTALDGTPGLRVIVAGPDAPTAPPGGYEGTAIVLPRGAYPTSIRYIDTLDVEVIDTDELIVI